MACVIGADTVIVKALSVVCAPAVALTVKLDVTEPEGTADAVPVIVPAGALKVKPGDTDPVVIA